MIYCPETITHTGFKTTGFYIGVGIICFFVALTIGGLVYMFKTHCQCKVQYCQWRKDLVC